MSSGSAASSVTPETENFHGTAWMAFHPGCVLMQPAFCRIVALCRDGHDFASLHVRRAVHDHKRHELEETRPQSIRKRETAVGQTCERLHAAEPVRPSKSCRQGRFSRGIRSAFHAANFRQQGNDRTGRMRWPREGRAPFRRQYVDRPPVHARRPRRKARGSRCSRRGPPGRGNRKLGIARVLLLTHRLIPRIGPSFKVDWPRRYWRSRRNLI